MGGRGGKSGKTKSAGGGGGSVEGEILSGLPDNSQLRKEKDYFSSINRSENDDQRAINALDLTEKQGLIDKKIKEIDFDLDKLKGEDKLRLKNLQDDLILKSKIIDQLKDSIKSYEQRKVDFYTNLNKVGQSEKLKDGSFKVFDKKAGIYQNNDLLNLPIKGKVIGSIGVSKGKERGSVNITHLPSGSSLGEWRKDKIGVNELKQLHDISKSFNHNANVKEMRSKFRDFLVEKQFPEVLGSR